ncbi:MAG: hypothetical protein ABIH23_08720, partial [bacterium]
MTEKRLSESGGLIRLQREGRLLPVGSYSDLVMREDLEWYVVSVSGLAGWDSTTGRVAGYEPHSGEYAPNALELQIEDIFKQLDALLELVAKRIGRRYINRQVDSDSGTFDVSLANLWRVTMYLRGDRSKDFTRVDDAYRAEFARRGVGVYPARTTTMGHHLPLESALVEIDFQVAIPKTADEIERT